jgi:two-component system sensor histidine kinase ComP
LLNKFRVTLFGLLLIVLTSYLSYSIVHFQVIGVGVTKDGTGQQVVTEVSPDDWGYGHIFIGDIITQIDGQPTSTYFTVRTYSYIEGASSIQLTRVGDVGDEQLTLSVEHGIPSNKLVLHFVLPICALILFSGFSILVYMRKKDDQAAIHLIMFFIAIGLAYLSSFSSGHLNPIGHLTQSVMFMLVPIFFMQFMNQYLKRYEERFVSRGLLKIFYVFMGMTLIYHQLRLLTGYLLIYQYASLLMLLFFVVTNVFIVYKLIDKFVKHRNDKHRSLFKLSFIGHVIGFVPFLLLFAIPSLFGVTLVHAELTTIFLFGIPIVYLYMFLTKQLFDIDFLLNRFIYYTMIAFFPTLIITSLAALIMSQDNYSWIKWAQMFLVIYMMITIFLFGKEFADIRLRPKFNKDLYNFQGSLDRFSKRISRVMKRPDLEKVLEQEILSILPVRNIAFLELRMDNDGHSSVDVIPEKVPPEVIVSLGGSSKRLSIGETLSVPQGLCVVIGHKRSTYHLLWIADKENHTRFNLDELGWLNTLANYSAIVYENLYLIEGLLVDLESEIQKQKGGSPWVLRLIFNLSENERRRLAADLHDSALQDQLIWYRRLEAAMQGSEMSPDLGLEMDTIREGLLDVIHQIRETCNELRPPLLKEMGIIEALERLFEEAQMRSNYAIDFRVTPFLRELSDEQILAIYRMVQELLRNASKHARASSVLIELEQQDNIRLYYKDNGVGMELRELGDSFQHMGLSGIQERVRSLEGEISFRSEVGEGFEVFITLPIETEFDFAQKNEGGGLDDTSLVS